MEFEELIGKIENIKKSIDDAFEKGTIDFDQISAELEYISSELWKRGENLITVSPCRHLLKTKTNQQIILTADYK